MASSTPSTGRRRRRRLPVAGDTAAVARQVAAGWGEPVRVDVLGTVTVAAERADGMGREVLGCLGEVFIEVFAVVAWPFVVVWVLVRAIRGRRPRHTAMPNGAAARAGATALGGARGEVAVVRSASRTALVAVLDGVPVVLWFAEGGARPQWRRPPGFAWRDGSTLRFARR